MTELNRARETYHLIRFLEASLVSSEPIGSTRIFPGLVRPQTAPSPNLDGV